MQIIGGSEKLGPRMTLSAILPFSWHAPSHNFQQSRVLSNLLVWSIALWFSVEWRALQLWHGVITTPEQALPGYFAGRSLLGDKLHQRNTASGFCASSPLLMRILYPVPNGQRLALHTYAFRFKLSFGRNKTIFRASGARKKNENNESQSIDFHDIYGHLS